MDIMDKIKSFPKTFMMSSGETNPKAEPKVSGAEVLLPEAQSAQPPANLAAEISGIVAEGQERLAMDLLAKGKCKEEILEALYSDLKTRQAKAEAAAPAPAVTKEEVAELVLKKMQAGTPQMPATGEQAGETNIREQYLAIKNPAERSAFYNAHKAEIDSHSTKTIKEG